MYKYFDLLKEIYENGAEVTSRGLKTKEILFVTLEVDKSNVWACKNSRPYEKVKNYLFGELAWYLSGERDIKNILPYSKFWENIRNPDNTANSNYGDLVFYRKNSQGITSFEWARQCLIEDKHTRKAIVLYNDRELFYQNNKDLICNQYQHFLIRNNKLLCFVALRSSDAIMGLSFNAPWWSLVQQQMRFELLPHYPELTLGPIKAILGSSHIYENKFELVKEMLADKKECYFLDLMRAIPLGKDFDWYSNNLINYIAVEKLVLCE